MPTYKRNLIILGKKSSVLITSATESKCVVTLQNYALTQKLRVNSAWSLVDILRHTLIVSQNGFIRWCRVHVILDVQRCRRRPGGIGAAGTALCETCVTLRVCLSSSQRIVATCNSTSSCPSLCQSHQVRGASMIHLCGTCCLRLDQERSSPRSTTTVPSLSRPPTHFASKHHLAWMSSSASSAQLLGPSGDPPPTSILPSLYLSPGLSQPIVPSESSLSSDVEVAADTPLLPPLWCGGYTPTL